MSVRRGIRVEVYRDGEWRHLDLRVTDELVLVQPPSELPVLSFEGSSEIKPPWRLYRDNELIAGRESVDAGSG